MYRGFPTSALSLLRCPKDGQPLHGVFDATHIMNGSVRCVDCTSSYLIESGILQLMDEDALDAESKGNLVVFDRIMGADNFASETELQWLKDSLPTLDALSPFEGKHVLEYGCGTGRLTVRIAPAASMLVAVDFSMEALRKLATRVEPIWNVAIVQADCIRSIAAAGAFDRALSTLISNLPTLEHRLKLIRGAATAIRSNGKFVFSAHYYGLRAFVKRSPRSGYYEQLRIFRYLSGRRELTNEAKVGFKRVICRPIVVRVPFERGLGLADISTARLLEKIPIINWMSDLLLVTADHPR
jgi:SAM-dependent methyltransferase